MENIPDLVVPLERHLVRTSLGRSRLWWEPKLEEVLFEEGWENEPGWACFSAS